MCILNLRKTLSNLVNVVTLKIKSTVLSHDMLTSRECRDVAHALRDF